MNKHIRGLLAVIFIVALIVTSVMLFTQVLAPPDHEPAAPQSRPEPSSELPEQSEQPAEATPAATPPLVPDELVYPVGKLVISGERKAYVGGDMLLEIPRLNLSSRVFDGTDDATLNKGVCLFEYAQLPGTSNSNTSMVAHRDIYGKEFYYIDTITDGDLMYLTYDGKKYTYEYLETFITGDSDWDPIRTKDFSCITLQSCDPIGTSLNRIFVTGRLIGIEDAGPVMQ